MNYLEFVRDNQNIDIAELRSKLGVSQVKFAEMFNIPARTMESWHTGKRVPPPYVLQLLAFAVESIVADKRTVLSAGEADDGHGT